ncbi:MAG: hypothetical protein AB1609_23475, partial [Bacillota bacterium]
LASGIDGRTGQVPMPAGVSPEAEYQPPEESPGAMGGPLMGEEAAKGAAIAAARAHSGAGCRVENVLTTHGALAGRGVFSPSFSVADSRQVYLVTVSGQFAFSGRAREPVIRADLINVEVDASTGEVLAAGTSKKTQDPEVLEALRAR